MKANVNDVRFVTHLEYEEKCVLYQYCLTILYEIFIVRFVINYLYCIYVFGLKKNPVAIMIAWSLDLQLPIYAISDFHH
jgi:hypothetical protein